MDLLQLAFTAFGDAILCAVLLRTRYVSAAPESSAEQEGQLRQAA